MVVVVLVLMLSEVVEVLVEVVVEVLVEVVVEVLVEVATREFHQAIRPCSSTSHSTMCCHVPSSHSERKAEV